MHDSTATGRTVNAKRLQASCKGGEQVNGDTYYIGYVPEKDSYCIVVHGVRIECETDRAAWDRLTDEQTAL